MNPVHSHPLPMLVKKGLLAAPSGFERRLNEG